MRIKIIVEDTYGGEFLKNVINDLKKEGLVYGNLHIPKPKHLPALCNTKLTRILKMFDNTCDRILVFLDSDDPQNFNDRYAKTACHIPNNMSTPVEIVLTDYEIEEWICLSLGLRWHSKPSEELKNKLGYEKSRLPGYSDKLDFDKLMKNCRSFKSFLNALKL
ncbi:hypothetical protein [Candidatus Pyrohabitans sp.]